MSQRSGLGVDESTIGGIVMASGLTHAFLQPSMYDCIFSKRGLKGSIKWAALFVIPVFFLVPFSLLSRKVGPDQHLRWAALIYLGVVLGLGRVFTVTFFSSISVAMNRLVPPHHRASFNGLLTKIAGSVRGMAPVMAGFFTSFSFSFVSLPFTMGLVNFVPRGLGGVLLYFTMGWMAILLAFLSFCLLGKDEFV